MEAAPADASAMANMQSVPNAQCRRNPLAASPSPSPRCDVAATASVVVASFRVCVVARPVPAVCALVVAAEVAGVPRLPRDVDVVAVGGRRAHVLYSFVCV